MDADRRRERRLFERVPTKIFVTLALKYQGWESQQSARAVDISRGGLRIRTEPALDEGQGSTCFPMRAYGIPDTAAWYGFARGGLSSNVRQDLSSCRAGWLKRNTVHIRGVQVTPSQFIPG